MLDTRCPECSTITRESSASLGEPVRCQACGSRFELNIHNLAKYQLPEQILVQLKYSDDKPFTGHRLPVMVNYGYSLPPLCCDPSGQLLITKEMFLRAEQDERGTGLMDHHGDFALNRYVVLRIVSFEEAVEMARARLASGWPISAFEGDLYGTLETLGAAYAPTAKVKPSETKIDLADVPHQVSVTMTIELQEQPRG